MKQSVLFNLLLQWLLLRSKVNSLMRKNDPRINFIEMNRTLSIFDLQLIIYYDHSYQYNLVLPGNQEDMDSFWDKEEMSSNIPISEYVTDDEIEAIKVEILKAEQRLDQFEKMIRTNDPYTLYEEAWRRHYYTRQINTRKQKLYDYLMDRMRRKLSKPRF